MSESWPTLVPQRITNWGQWPDDVEATIRAWNRSKGLSFSYIGTGRVNGIPYFECDDCHRFIRIRGADRCLFRDRNLCEECLILLARQEPA